MDASGKSAARESAHRDRCNTDVVTARGQQGGASSNSMKKASHGSSMSATQLTGSSNMGSSSQSFIEWWQLQAGQDSMSCRGDAVTNIISSITDANTPLTAALAATLTTQYPVCYEYARLQLQTALSACTDAPKGTPLSHMWGWLCRRGGCLPPHIVQQLTDAVNILQRVNPGLSRLLSWLEQRPQMMLRAQVPTKPIALYNKRSQVGGAARPGVRLQAARGASQKQLAGVMGRNQLLKWQMGCMLYELTEKEAQLRSLGQSIEDKDCVLGAFASTFKYNSKVRTVISTTMHGAARSVGGLAKELKTLQSDNTKLKAGLSAVKATRYKVPLDAVHAEIDTENKDLHAKLDREAAEKVVLKRQINELRTRIAAYERNEMLFMSAREIKCERDRLQRRVHELESEVVRLKNSLAASHKQAVDAVKEKKEAEHTAATATRNLKNATSQINQLEAAAAEAAKREINMKQEIESLRASYTAVQQQLLSVQPVEVADLLSKTNQLGTALQEAQVKVAKEHEVCSQARNQVRTVTHVSDNQAARLKKAEAAVASLQKELEKEKLATAAAFKAKIEAELQIKQLKDQMTKSKGEVSKASGNQRG